MLRTAVRPRWLLLLAVVLAASAGMARLGEWQLNRARESSRSAEVTRLGEQPVPLTSVVVPRAALKAEAVNRPVTASGRWDAGRRVLLPGRELDGRRGLWVLTPLVLADGSAVPVVRGWVASPADAPIVDDTASAAPVTVTGVLRVPEPRFDTLPGTDLGLPPDQLPRIDVTELVKRWPYPLVDAWVQAESQTPAAPAAIRPVPVEATSGGFAWRNLSYALQWWIFAACGLFLWWRLVRDDHQRRAAADPSDPDPDPKEAP
ncbi:MAG: SURF1 family protein [Kineosporiaceae bacterium]